MTSHEVFWWKLSILDFINARSSDKSRKMSHFMILKRQRWHLYRVKNTSICQWDKKEVFKILFTFQETEQKSNIFLDLSAVWAHVQSETEMRRERRLRFHFVLRVSLLTSDPTQLHRCRLKQSAEASLTFVPHSCSPPEIWKQMRSEIHCLWSKETFTSVLPGRNQSVFNLTHERFYLSDGALNPVTLFTVTHTHSSGDRKQIRCLLFEKS